MPSLRRQGPDVPPDAWRRLAELLIERRSELRPEWATRAAFCADHPAPSSKSIMDLEANAGGLPTARQNFTPRLLAKFDAAYQWAPGSCLRVLYGGDPEPRAPSTEQLDVLLDALRERQVDAGAIEDLRRLYLRGDGPITDGVEAWADLRGDPTVSRTDRRHFLDRLEMAMMRYAGDMRHAEAAWRAESDSIRQQKTVDYDHDT